MQLARAEPPPSAAARPAGAERAVRAAAAYDYLLVVGPGRSGSELLYENLRRHPAFAFPEIKEGYYYRSRRAFAAARRRLDGGRARILADIANLAYRDPALAPGVAALRAGGCRALLVLLLRDHRERVASMIRFRRSRGEITAILGARRLGRAVLRDSLTPEDLAALYRIDADVLAIGFPALTGDTAGVLETLTALCGVPPPARVVRRAVNESVAARHPLLSACGKAAAVALRRVGRRRLLQRLKDNPRLRRLFFVPLAGERGGGADGVLPEGAAGALDAAAAECRAIVERASEPLAPHVHLRRAGRGAA